MIDDTSKQYGPLDLPVFGGSSRAIDAMEAEGQRQLVASCDLPTKGSEDPEFLRLGFTFGEPHAHDPLFRPATLPKGWRKQGTDHSMHVKIVDELGRERVGVFYKAAFYDRRADMRLISVAGYVMHLLYNGESPILDDEWATAEAVTEAARAEIKRARESLELWQRPEVVARNDAKYIADRVAECRRDIRKAEALIAQVTS
jgi:hypothetical protein